MIRQCFIALSFLLSTFAVNAPAHASASAGKQYQRVIDSLKSVIEQANHDTSVCNAYMSWANQVYLKNPDTALILVQKVADLAQQNLRSSLPASHRDPAIEKKYLFILSEALNNIGYICKNQGDIPKALVHYHKSLKIREEVGDKNGIAVSLNNIGAIYDDQGDILKALEYYHMSLKIKEEIGDKKGIAVSLNNIGGIYKLQGDLSKALVYYHKSLKIDEEMGSKEGIAISLNNIGYIYKNQGDIPKALVYYHKSLKIKEDIGNKEGIATSLDNIGYTELEVGNLTNALKYGIRGLDIAREIGSPHLISANSSLLSKVAKKQGRFEKALEMYELHILMRDSINNEENLKATIRQQTKYEFEKAQLIKEQEEKEATRILSEETSRRDNLQYSVILIAILVLFGGVLSLGFINVSERVAEGIIFFSFLILFEFLLVLADPYIDRWSGGAPGFKLLFNAGIAALIFPLHSLFETKLKVRLVKS